MSIETIPHVESVEFSDSPALDAFGRQRVSNPAQRYEVEFIYDKQDDLVDEVTTGAGTVTHNANSRDITLAINSTTNGDEAAMYTYDIPYTPANSQLVEFTGVLDLANLGTGSVEVFVRTKTSGSVVEATYAQSTWDTATTGVNWEFSHIFGIDLQSLKVGRIRFFLNQSGRVVTIKNIVNDNIRNTGFWQLPSLPVYWRIYNDTTNTYMEMGYGDEDNAVGYRYTVTKNATATMKAICAAVKSEGSNDLIDLPGFNRSADMGVTEATVSTTLIPLISIRPKTTFNSLTNRGLALPLSFTVTTDNPIKYIVLHDATLTGASWTDVDTTYSAVEYDVSASSYTGGHVIFSDYLNSGKGSPETANNALGRTLLWNRRNGGSGILTLAAIKTGAANASVLGAIRWKEIR